MSRRSKLLLFPALALGVFWKRGNQAGAIAGMAGGFGVCVFYMLATMPQVGGSAANQWFGIAPISAGVFGVPAGMALLVVVSLLTTSPGPAARGLVDHLRSPD